jgi:inosose dehydratase
MKGDNRKMSVGYMTNAFGPLVGAGGGVTSVKDIRYVTMGDEESIVRKISSCGFHSIEIFDGNLMKYEDSQKEFLQMLKNNDSSLLGVYIGANFIYKDALPDELYRIERVSKLAEQLGARHIVLGGGAIRAAGIQNDDYALLADGLDKANAIVKKYHLIASYHPHLGSITEHPDAIDRVFALTDIPFCPDLAHLAAGGCDTMATVKKYRDRIRYVHLKDLNHGEFSPLGKGQLPLSEIIDFMKQTDFQGDWLVEVDGYSGDPCEACCTSYHFLKDKLDV